MAEIVLKLRVRDLTRADLADCAWSGSAAHLKAVAHALDRARVGAVDYLAVCPPSDRPVAIGGVSYEVRPDAGVLWQLVVHPALQSCGIGTLLIGAAEQRIRGRGRSRAELRVEEGNPRARVLYERLGYVAYATLPDAWYVEAPDGSMTRYETTCVLMGKDLDGP